TARRAARGLLPVATPRSARRAHADARHGPEDHVHGDREPGEAARPAAAAGRRPARSSSAGRTFGPVTILVTGAAGFVGSHFARVAHAAGLRVAALDDLSTSTAWPRVPDAIERVVGDVGDRQLVSEIVSSREVTAVVHFAGRIRVDESVREPALYF